MRRAKALTLIEVVASLLLVATTVTSILTAHARSLAQLRATREQAIAAAWARELIVSWKIDPPPPGTHLEGRFETQAQRIATTVDTRDWRWARTARPYMESRTIPIQQIHLTIYRTADRSREEIVKTYTWLARIDHE